MGEAQTGTAALAGNAYLRLQQILSRLPIFLLAVC